MSLSFKNKLWIFILIVLSSLSFYNPLGLVSPQFGKLVFYALSFYAILLALRNGYSLNRLDYPHRAYKLLMLGFLSSIFMVVLFQEQSFSVTLTATLQFIFSYSLFYVLMRFSIPKESVERALLAFGIIGMCIYAVNMMTFPRILFGVSDEEYDSSRGIVRLGIPSLLLVVLCFFYSINKWMLSKRKKYIWFILISYTFIFLSVTRQVILFATLFGLLFIMQRASLRKKVMVVLLGLAFVLFVLPKIPIYQSLVEVSKAQAERNQNDVEDVRIRAWRFYTYEYQTNAATVLFGNGIPAKDKSPWADKHWQTVSYEYGGNGCFTVDVGWAGYFWYFGLLATLGLLVLMLKAVAKRKSLDKQYLTYWCLYIVFTAVLSGPILFSNHIVNIVSVLYLVYGRESNGNNNTQLQQCGRHC